MDAGADATAALTTSDVASPAGLAARRLTDLQDDAQQRAAREFAERLGARRRDAGAPVRRIFVSDEHVERPTLARLLSGTGTGGGGGRGGQLRVKLYLSLLWVCAKEPYNVALPARAWAALLGLPDHENRGVRRIQQTLRELEDRRLVRLEDRGGLPTRVFPLNEKGDGSAFLPAPEAHSRLQQTAGESVLREHRYFRVPTTLWTKGHVAQLSGPGLAMLLALLSERRGNPEPGVWFSPARATDRFGFAASTRAQGLAQLRALGLVRTTVRTVSENGAYIDFARRRNVHEVTL